jgi:hypothetical protein
MTFNVMSKGRGKATCFRKLELAVIYVKLKIQNLILNDTVLNLEGCLFTVQY